MKKAKSLGEKDKPVKPGKRKPLAWSMEKAALLRKPLAMPSGGDCNCGGK